MPTTKRLNIAAHDSLMRPQACDLLANDREAFIEVAASCGLAALSPQERNPLRTSSFGVGEQIAAALDLGCTNITIGLGGSSTNDGGMGCLRALGIRFYDAQDHELDGCGADLERVACIDVHALHHRVRTASFVLMCDVDNPLLGEQGATRVFGPQKGASETDLARLEAGMRNFAQIIAAQFRMEELSASGCADESPAAPRTIDFSTPGFGAAGGLGMALSVFLNAQMRSGIEELLRWIDFDRLIKDADLVVTGEGKLDGQSLHGKAVGVIAAHARRQGVPVSVICGTCTLDRATLHELGITSMQEIGAGQPLEYAISHAADNYARAAYQLFERFSPSTSGKR